MARQRKKPDESSTLDSQRDAVRVHPLNHKVQAKKLLLEIQKEREGKKFRMVKVDHRTWKEVEIA